MDHTYFEWYEFDVNVFYAYSLQSVHINQRCSGESEYIIKFQYC